MSTAETLSVAEAVAVVTELYGDTLAISSERITTEAADRATKHIHTTTELLLLLARFHADNDDSEGSRLLATFAATFAEQEARTI